MNLWFGYSKIVCCKNVDYKNLIFCVVCSPKVNLEPLKPRVHLAKLNFKPFKNRLKLERN